MKALTLIQPWAHAIVHWGKRVENRGWKPPERVIGKRIAIHAGAKFEKDTFDDLTKFYNPKRDESTPVVRKAIAGTAVVAGWIDADGGHSRSLTQLEANEARASSWYVHGQIGWVLRDVRELPAPVPCKGALGLWDAPSEVAS